MEKKTLRLSKLAIEFNVGVNTLIDFLHQKGYHGDLNPNAKIEEDWYDVLMRQFKSQMIAKEESQKVSLKKKGEKKESVSIEDLKKDERIIEIPNEEVVLIKDFSGKSIVEEKSVKKEKKSQVVSKEIFDKEIIKEEIKEISSKSGDINIKLIGKIDIESNLQTIKQTQEKDIIKEDKIILKQGSLFDEVPVDEVEEKIESNQQLTDIAEEHESREIIDTKIEIETTEIKEHEIMVIEAQIEESQNKNEDQKEMTETIETKSVFEVTGIKEGDVEVKVVGRIDLDSINQRTRPPKKTKRQKEEERRKKEKAMKDAQKAALEVVKEELQNLPPELRFEEEVILPLIINKKFDPDDSLFRTKIKKLSGPTVVGKIALDDVDAKKKVAIIEKKKKKKKRKRIQREQVLYEDDKTTPKDPKKVKEDDKAAPKKDKKVKKLKKVIKREVDDEEVAKQIKETLARLTAGKQKGKGAKYRRQKRELNSQKIQLEVEEQEKQKYILKVTEFVSVNELANMMNTQVNQIIATCMNLGLFVSINQRLDAETITLLADEFGYSVEFITSDLQETIVEEIDAEEKLLPRSPIVTVMGHVDHGKTSLLDYIRNSSVTTTEAGGITQHIGAYTVTLDNGKRITFLDTPGHQAFTAMRARGAKVTDIAIIVVAADDNVMPQTIEAINHAQAAAVPIIFAVNKIDKPGANPEKIKEELAKMNLLVEEWGGKYQSQDISAKKGTNIDLLLEKVLLEAEMLDLKANPNRKAKGTVIESSLDKGRGYIATLLNETGTLKIGDIILAGSYYGRVKAMYNEFNQKVISIGPSDPVLVLGLNGAPQAGDNFNVLESEHEAKEIANRREQLQREQGLRTKKHITLEEIGRRIAIGNFKELNVIVKGDVDGSVEALSDSLIKLSTEQIQVNVIHKAVGQIAESDISLATASNAVVIGFQVRPALSARKLAEVEGIEIRLYSVIYDAINDIKDAMEGMLAPELKEEIIGTAEIKEVFKINKVGNIAGCIVKDGKITRNAKIRLIREGIVVYTGELESLKRFKDDFKEVKSGQDCGLNLARFNDIKVGDIIEGFEETEVKQTL